LVVVAIISLLSSIVLAALKDARDKARMSAFIQETRQLILAFELYKQNNNGSLPSEDTDEVNLEDLIQNELSNYISDYPVYPYDLSGGYDHFFYSNNKSSGDDDMNATVCDGNLNDSFKNRAGIFLYRENWTEKEIKALADSGWIGSDYNPPPGNSTLGLCLPIYY
jgi:type II secretory pathway pseudopilin PulG